MATPNVTMNCNSLPLTAIETATVNCELDTTNKKFGSGSIKILQGGYIDVAMPSNFNMLTDSWTVEHWFSITALETDNYHHLINADNNANGQWAVYVDNTGKLTLNRRGGEATTSTVAIANNEWHHLRVTHTGNETLKAYLDGNLFATNTFYAAPDSMRIGKTLGKSTRWYTGNIDEIALTILDTSNVAEYSGDTAPVPTEGYPDEVRSPGVVINGLFLSTSKPKDGDKGLLVNNKFFIPFAESSEGGSGGDTSAFESDAMAIIGTPTGEGGDIEPISQKYMTVTSTDDVGCGVGIEFTGTIQIVEDGVATLYTTSPISNIALRNATVYGDNITYFNCGSTNLASVDPSHNDQLVTLICSNGYLTALDISNNSLLTTLEANSNNLSSAVVDKILSDLVAHGKSNGLLRLENSAGIGAASNGAPTSQNNVTTLQSRGWTVTTA